MVSVVTPRPRRPCEGVRGGPLHRCREVWVQSSGSVLDQQQSHVRSRPWELGLMVTAIPTHAHAGCSAVRQLCSNAGSLAV